MNIHQTRSSPHTGAPVANGIYFALITGTTAVRKHDRGGGVATEYANVDDARFLGFRCAKTIFKFLRLGSTTTAAGRRQSF